MRLPPCTTPRSRLRLALTVAAPLFLASCAAPVALTVLGASSGVAMGTSIDYTLNGIAYKTFNTSLPETRIATRTAFRRMDLRPVRDQRDPNSADGWQITGSANDRTIEITLESLTPKTTRMRIVVNNGVFFKDRATEAAIIDQVADAIDAQGARLARKPN